VQQSIPLFVPAPAQSWSNGASRSLVSALIPPQPQHWHQAYLAWLLLCPALAPQVGAQAPLSARASSSMVSPASAADPFATPACWAAAQAAELAG